MIVVSDTSVLHYLVEINQIELLPKLFAQVLIPRAVLAELQHPSASEKIKHWAQNLPRWIEVHQVDGGSLLKLLDVGEAEAIVLAEQKHCPILIDEADGRKIAREKGLMITGLIGVLEVGAELGYIDLAACFAALRQTRFRIHPNILDEALKRLKKPS